jgi:hypothetical protein
VQEIYWRKVKTGIFCRETLCLITHKCSSLGFFLRLLATIIGRELVFPGDTAYPPECRRKQRDLSSSLKQQTSRAGRDTNSRNPVTAHENRETPSKFSIDNIRQLVAFFVLTRLSRVAISKSASVNERF